MGVKQYINCVALLGWIVSACPVEVAMTEQLTVCKLHFPSPQSAPDIEFCLLGFQMTFPGKHTFVHGKELQHEWTILEDTPHTLTAAYIIDTYIHIIMSYYAHIGLIKHVVLPET